MFLSAILTAMGLVQEPPRSEASDFGSDTWNSVHSVVEEEPTSNLRGVLPKGESESSGLVILNTENVSSFEMVELPGIEDDAKTLDEELFATSDDEVLAEQDDNKSTTSRGGSEVQPQSEGSEILAMIDETSSSNKSFLNWSHDDFLEIYRKPHMPSAAEYDHEVVALPEDIFYMEEEWRAPETYGRESSETYPSDTELFEQKMLELILTYIPFK